MASQPSLAVSQSEHVLTFYFRLTYGVSCFQPGTALISFVHNPLWLEDISQSRI